MSPKNRGHIKPYRVSKNGSLMFFVGLTLMPGRDDDLIAALTATPLGQVSATVREMMRSGISTSYFVAEGGKPVEVDMALAALEI